MRLPILPLAVLVSTMLSGCTFSKGESTTRLAVSMRDADPNLADFACFFVNISGSNISPTISTGDADAQCMGLGIVSNLFSAEEHVKEPLLLKVPSGAARTMRVIGVKQDAAGTRTCKGLISPQDLFSSLQPVLHVVSSTTTDIYKDVRIDLRNQYDKDKASDLVAPCVTKKSASPTVTAITPNVIPVAGGETVTITGTNFVEPIAVYLAETECTATVISSETLTCKAQARVYGTGDVVVKTGAGAGTLPNGITYLGALLISSASPAIGSTLGGTFVTIDGVGFVTGSTVQIEGNPCTLPVVLSQTSLTCFSPPGIAGAAIVKVFLPDSTNATAPSIFAYAVPPQILSLGTTTFGPLAGGNTIGITGSDFMNPTVTLGGAACTDVAHNATSISCKPPAHAEGDVAVTVKNEDGLSATLDPGYTYTGPPTVTAVTPGIGISGQDIVITGTKFRTGVIVQVGGSNCNPTTYTSVTQAICKLPTLATGTYTVRAINADTQDGLYSGTFSVLPQPAPTGVTPSAGTTEGGTLVTVTGNNFAAGLVADFSGIFCAPVNFIDEHNFTCTTAATENVGVPMTLTVRNLDGQSGERTNAYTYVAGPSITGVVVPTPLASGQTHSLNIIGTFSLPVAVTLKNGINCPVSSPGTTTIVCDAPGLPAGFTDVTVTETSTLGSTTRRNAYPVGIGEQWIPAAVASAPSARFGHTALPATADSNFSKIAIWGGQSVGSLLLNDGAFYDVNKDAWFPLSSVGTPPSARTDHTAVWSGNEMVIWGGRTATGVTNTGSGFNPLTNSWNAMSVTNAPQARARHKAVWSGNEMIVFGGIDSTLPNPYLLDAGRYRFPTGWDTNMAQPSEASYPGRTDHTFNWVISRAVVVGGRNTTQVFGDAFGYDPTTGAGGAWGALSPANHPGPRHSHVAAIAGSFLIVHGGSATVDDIAPLLTGGRLGTSDFAWNPNAMATGPVARLGHGGVGLNGGLYVWGGRNGGIILNDGSFYNPGSGLAGDWTAITGTAAPTGRSDFTMTLTPQQFFVFGGTEGSDPVSTGAHYLPP